MKTVTLDDLALIGQEIRTQDNLCTCDPIFLVQQRQRIYGMDNQYCEDFVWMGDDWEEITDPDELAKIEEDEDAAEEKGYVKNWYMDQWLFVTCCFTRKAAEEYIEGMRHRLTEPRIYVDSGYRNDEWIMVRNFIMSQALRGRVVD